MASILGWILAIQESQVALIKKIALVFFFVVFLGIVVRLLMTRAGTYDRASRLPLRDDDESGDDALQRRRPGEQGNG